MTIYRNSVTATEEVTAAPKGGWFKKLSKKAQAQYMAMHPENAKGGMAKYKAHMAAAGHIRKEGKLTTHGVLMTRADRKQAWKQVGHHYNEANKALDAVAKEHKIKSPHPSGKWDSHDPEDKATYLKHATNPDKKKMHRGLAKYFHEHSKNAEAIGDDFHGYSFSADGNDDAAKRKPTGQAKKYYDQAKHYRKLARKHAGEYVNADIEDRAKKLLSK